MVVTWAQPVVNGLPGGDDLRVGHNRYKLLDPATRDAFLKLDESTRNLMEKVKEAIKNCPVKIKFEMTGPSKFYLYLFTRNLHLLPKGKDKEKAEARPKEKTSENNEKLCKSDEKQFYDCVIQESTKSILAKMVADPYFDNYLQFNYDQNITESSNTIKFLESIINENKK